MGRKSYVSSLEDIKRVARVIAERFRPRKIVLFGSHARGEATYDSDVDFLVVMDTKLSRGEQALRISRVLPHEFPMDIIVRSPDEVARRLEGGDLVLKEMLEEGEILYEARGERVG